MENEKIFDRWLEYLNELFNCNRSKTSEAKETADKMNQLEKNHEVATQK